MALETDTSTADDDGFSSVFKVLETAELLDSILSFLDTKNLLIARQVSNFWRSTAHLTLRRRLFAEETNHFRYYGVHKFALQLKKSEAKVQLKLQQLDIPPEPIPSSSIAEVEIQVGDEVESNVEKFVPAPALSPMLSMLLTFDWAVAIQRLDLGSNAVTVQEWNAMSLYLLSVMTSLRHLTLSVASQRAWSGDWDDVPAVEATSVVSNLETVVIRYWHFEGKDFQITDRLLDLKFLELCPNLESFQVSFVYSERPPNLRYFEVFSECGIMDVDWIFRKPTDSYPFRKYRLKGNGSVSSSAGISCDMMVLDNFELGDPRITGLNSLLTILKPKFIYFKYANNYLAHIPVEPACNLKSLHVDVPLGTSADWIVSNLLNNIEAFHGINQLRITNVNPNDYPAERFPKKVEFAMFTQRMPNVTSLTIDALFDTCRLHEEGSERPTWAETQTDQMGQTMELMPNVEFFMVHSDCDCFLEHAHKLHKLRHLVMWLSPQKYRSMADKYKEELRKVKGLQTLTLILSERFLKEYVSGVKNLLKTVTSTVASLKVVQVLYTATDDETSRRVFEEMVNRCRAEVQSKWEFKCGVMEDRPSLENLDRSLCTSSVSC